ncbi:D-aminoacyl-tRNA deacylase [uncultured Pseudoteredinibacter sp.]|uniref:D-aminoacyl-tRNA deacylase n=1 Tax=uncultured Pseudoteredinibacter sp. TaxID=1641701 RepID=UPI0026373A9E|nr:D-aminoacyl-tRNA deacylase [uncultured Pseudoteredinibacter sp.]
MKGLIQRVSHANVVVAGEEVGAIEQGILLLLGIEKDDGKEQADKLLDKLLKYRIFSDEQERMNLSVSDIEGGVLAISQFTLAAETKKGLRPGFSTAKPPAEAEELYNYFVSRLQEKHQGKVATGEFGADMKVSLCNDGPVTFMLEV